VAIEVPALPVGGVGSCGFSTSALSDSTIRQTDRSLDLNAAAMTMISSQSASVRAGLTPKRQMHGGGL